ncbi:hypothetical protein EDD85DRAFT_823764 [Armillaria nabsnona]|nr:hypothetical protein EDD85DRAFT_823764 [Armillaria nabsnona]
MPKQLICQCLHDEIMSFGTLHSLPDGHYYPCFEPLPMKVATCRSCIHPTMEDDDDEGPSCHDGPLLLNFSHSQSAVQLSTDTTHVLILSPLPSVSESPAATPTITTVFIDHNVMDLHHQSSDLGPTDRVKSRSCIKKKKTKGKKRARDASGTEEDNGEHQTKRKKGKGSKGRNSGVLPPTQSGHVTDKASWGSSGTRNLERRVLEDITNRVLHAVT